MKGLIDLRESWPDDRLHYFRSLKEMTLAMKALGVIVICLATNFFVLLRQKILLDQLIQGLMTLKSPLRRFAPLHSLQASSIATIIGSSLFVQGCT